MSLDHIIQNLINKVEITKENYSEEITQLKAHGDSGLDALILTLGRNRYLLERGWEQLITKVFNDDFIPTEQLIARLEASEHKVRVYTAWLLNYLREEKAAESLAKCFTDISPIVRHEAAKALINIGKGGVEIILAQLQSPVAEVRMEALEYFPTRLYEELFREDAIALFKIYLNDPDRRVFYRVVRKIVANLHPTYLQYDAVIDELIMILQQGDTFKSKVIASKIGYCREPRVIRVLIDALNDKRKKVQEKSALSLQNLGIVRAYSPTARAYVAREIGLRKEALDSSCIPAILEALNSQVWDIRCVAAELLGYFKDINFIPLLEKLLKDENGTVRQVAQNAIENIKYGFK